MSYDNVKLWFAKNKDEDIVTIDEINENNKNNTYLCPMCGSILIPKATKSKQVTSHFAHVDVSKCNSESMIHWWFKHKFIESGDSFVVVSGTERQYICKDVFVEQTYSAAGKEYRPDVTVITECGRTVYFEMDYSNKKKIKDYIDVWLELRNIVVEVDVKKKMSKDKIPTFKALFYDGKCFNVKKNDLYYNTIGKYKEDKLKEKVDTEVKNRIQKLDWFWDDIFRYRHGDVDIQHITFLIDSFNKEEREIVNIILNKPSCNHVFKEYLINKSQTISRDLMKHFKSLYPDVDFELSASYPRKSRYHNKFTSELKFTDIKENSVGTIDISEHSQEEIKNKVENWIKDIIKKDKHRRDLGFARENVHIKNVIEKLNEKYKEIDENYSFYHRFGYDLYASFYYNSNCKVDICIINNDSIIYSNDEQLIEMFFEDKINEYFNTVTPFENLDLLSNNIDSLINYYEQSGVCIKKEIYEEKIGRRKWVTKSKNIEVRYKVAPEYLAQDLIMLTLYKDKDNYLSKLKPHLLIYKNKLYTTNSCYFDRDFNHYLEENSDLKAIKEFNSTWNGLIRILTKYFNDFLRNNMNLTCISCDQHFILENGEVDFFIKNKLNFPRRCKSCRELKRPRNKGGNTYQSTTVHT